MAKAGWAAIRYRRTQALVVLAFAALVTASAVFGPLATRSLLESVTVQRLAALDPAGRAVLLRTADPERAGPAVSPESLPALVPASLQRFFAAPVTGLTVEVAASPPDAAPGPSALVGELLWQDGACDGVRFTAGRCPAAQGEVAVTTAQARLSSWPPGTRLRLTERATPDGALVTRTVVTVVGVYDQRPVPQWFGAALDGRAGTSLQDGGRGMDTLLAARPGLEDPQPTAGGGKPLEWHGVTTTAGFALRPGTGLDGMFALGRRLDPFVAAPAGETSIQVAVTTGLPGVVADLRRDAAQAAVTVPLLVGQLVLVLAWVLWIVLSALVQQRRPEVALARLRGRGTAGARRLLLGETLPVVLAGVPVGAALGWAGTAAVSAAVLPGAPAPQLHASVLVALAVATAVLVVLTVASTRRVVAEPVATALRAVPARAGLALGLAEAMVVTVGVAAYLALVHGDLTGPGALVAPALLALAAGVLLGRVAGPVAVRAGRWLLARGRVAPAGALLTAARRPGARWVVPVATVAVALCVVSVDVLAVAGRNAGLRARAEVGAPLVAQTDATDVTRLRTALAALDPVGTQATPVVLLRPPSVDALTTQAVLPEGFGRIALAPREAPAALWRRLDPPATPAWTLRGTTLTARVGADKVAVPGRAPTYEVGLRVVLPDAEAVTVTLAEVGAGGRPDGPVTVSVPCRASCRVVALLATAPAGQLSTSGTFRLGGLAVDGTPAPLPDASAWRGLRTDTDTAALRAPAPDTVSVTFTRAGAGTTAVLHASVEPVVPALVSRPAAPDVTPPDAVRQAVGPDGAPVPFRVTGVLRYAPGAPARTTVVDLDALTALGGRLPGNARMLVYSARDDAVWQGRLTKALAAQGIRVLEVTRATEVAQGYQRSAAGWSARLGAVVAALAVVLGALALVVVAAAGWRSVRRDHAGLRVAGMPPRTLRRLALWESVPLILAGGLAGLGAGLAGALAVIGLVPIFPVPPDVDVLDLSLAARPALGAGVAALVALALVGLAASLHAAGAPAAGDAA